MAYFFFFRQNVLCYNAFTRKKAAPGLEKRQIGKAKKKTTNLTLVSSKKNYVIKNNYGYNKS